MERIENEMLLQAKPCPFCEGKDLKFSDIGFGHQAIKCKRCYCYGAQYPSRDKQNALEAWNRRSKSEWNSDELR